MTKLNTLDGELFVNSELSDNNRKLKLSIRASYNYQLYVRMNKVQLKMLITELQRLEIGLD